MTRFKQSPYVFVQETAGRGLGVFARKLIPENTVIERVPVLIFPTKFLWHPEETSPLADYVFTWDDDRVALALGFGSLYNHSFTPNAIYEDWGENKSTTRQFEKSGKVKRSPSTTTDRQTTVRRLVSM